MWDCVQQLSSLLGSKNRCLALSGLQHRAGNKAGAQIFVDCANLGLLLGVRSGVERVRKRRGQFAQ